MSESENNPEPVHKFCETMKIAANKDVFLLGMQSGGELNAFVVTPDHAKQIWRLLGQNLEQYEKAYGELEGRLPSDPQLSPMQIK